MPPLEKLYHIVRIQRESLDIVPMEIVDASSKPQMPKNAVFRLGQDDFEALGMPTISTGTKRLKVTLEIVDVPAEKPST